VDIYLIRHGEMELEENAETDIDLINGYATGTMEGPLSPKGLVQARCVAQELARIRVQVVYSSMFIRARQTAEETSKLVGVPVTLLKEFGELNVGRLAPDSEPKQAFIFMGLQRLHGILPHLVGPLLTKRILGYFLIVFYFMNWYTGRTIAGENPKDALARIRRVLGELTERHGAQDKVAVFTHGYFIHLLVNHVLDPLGAPLRMLKSPYIKNGSITHLALSPTGKWTVKAYSQTSHLR
jgi:broad specificity phosphatase PhoE